MIKSTVNARENITSALEILNDKFPKRFISDARYLDFKNKKVIGVSHSDKILPYTFELLNDEFLRQFFQSIQTNEILVDLDFDEILLSGGGKIIVPDEVKGRIDSIKRHFSDYGGRINSKGEHTINLKSEHIGPHFDVNLLLGIYTSDKDPLLKTPKSVVNSLGEGSFRGESNFQISATKWGISPYENGDPLNRQFYIIEKGKQIFFSGDITEEMTSVTCVHSPNFTTITYVVNDLKIVRKIFILGKHPDVPDALEVQQISVENLTDQVRELQLVAVGMFGLSNPDCQKIDIIYQTVITQTRIFNNENNAIVAVSPDYYPKYFRDKMRFATLRCDQGYADSFTNNYNEFLNGGSIKRPKGILNFSNSLERSGASFFALKKSFTLQSKTRVRFDDMIGATYVLNKGDENIVEKLTSDLDSFIEKYPTSEALDKLFEEDVSSYVRYVNYLQVNTKDASFDSYVNNNLPFQVLYQSFVSRGFAQTQKGYREIGFREIQDLFASMYYLFNEGKQDLVKRMLSYWIENIYEFGYANHNFFYKGKEPGMCSDDQLWLVQAISRYINLSRDVSFLEKSFNMAGSKKKRKLYDTLKVIITYSAKISIGKHGLPLLDSSDWNDTLKLDDDYLDGPSKEKAYKKQLRTKKEKSGCPFESDYSESVMNGFLLVIAIQNMKDMALLKRDDEYGEYLEKLIQEKKADINASAYIDGYYARALINKKNANNVKYVGAKGDGLSLNKNIDGSFYLNSFSWALLSGTADYVQIASMLNTVDKYLKTPAGYILCTNSNLSIAGSKQASTDHYHEGDRENGGVFKHAAMMAVVAMLKVSKDESVPEDLRIRLIDDAFYMLNLVLPYKTLNNPYVLKGNPRYCTQYNNSKTMENIGPILSGTASWLTLAIYEIVGIEYAGNQLIFKPVLSKDMTKFEAILNMNGTKLNIKIEKNKGEYLRSKASEMRLDGAIVDSKVLPKFNDGKTHSLEIKQL